MKLSGYLLSAIVFGTITSSASASADDLRSRQTAACFNDAMRLCSDFVLDEKQIAACMIGKRTSLSSGCRVFFSASSQAGVLMERRSVVKDD